MGLIPLKFGSVQILFTLNLFQVTFGSVQIMVILIWFSSTLVHFKLVLFRFGLSFVQFKFYLISKLFLIIAFLTLCLCQITAQPYYWDCLSHDVYSSFIYPGNIMSAIQYHKKTLTLSCYYLKQGQDLREIKGAASAKVTHRSNTF